MTQLILKYRWLIISLSLLIALAGALQLPRMETDPDIQNYIPKILASRLNTDIIESEFGNQELVMLLFRDSTILTSENLTRIKSIDRSLRRLSLVDNTISLFNTKRIHGESGIMYVDPALSRIPSSESDTRKLREELSDNPLVMGVVISDDFSMSVIAVSPEEDVSEKSLLRNIDSVLAEYPGKAEVYFGGLPYIRKAIIEDVRRDGLILIPLALVIMLLFLWISFREWKGVLLPFAVVLLSIAIAMGLAPLLGWKLSVLSLLVPIILIAVANDYGIHMIAKYQELSSSNRDLSMPSISKGVVRKLRMPILFTGLTTIAGILGLLTHSVIPAKHVGVLAAVGIAFAIAFTLFMLPAWLSMLKRKGANIRGPKIGNSYIDRKLASTAGFVNRNSSRILAVSGIITLVFLIGIFRIKVDGNQENFFPARHPVKEASTLINDNFGGSQSISLLYRGDIKDPVHLNQIERWVNEIELCNGVDNVYSISTVIKEMSKSLFDKSEPGYDKIPESREGVAQLLELYNMSGDPDDFERLVDFDYSSAHLVVRFSQPETDNINGVLAKIDELSRNSGAQIIKGGYAYVMSEFADKIVKGQVTSLLFAVVAVFVLLSLIFKSLKGGAISALPILASVIFLLGFMGYTGITLNPATALLSSIMIGVGVDYTIHFLWRYRSELKINNRADAVRITLTTTGRGIVFNALSVIVGFAVLLFSGFTSIRYFGYIILISIGVCLISSLVVIPALMLILKPRFIEKKYIKVFKERIKLRRVMRRAVFLILIGLTTGAVLAQNRSIADDIMKKSSDVLKVESFESRSLLKIVDSKGRERIRENITASKKYTDGTVKRIIKFLSPADIKGTTVLIYDYDNGNDDMWIYLPALKKSRRMVSSEKSRSFMGSDFSNSDMSSPPIEDFNHKVLDELSDDRQWVIESTPKSIDLEEEYGYSRRLNYVNKSDYTISVIEFYDFENTLFKTININGLKALDNGKYVVNNMIARNIVKERFSEITLNDIIIGQPLRDDLFNAANLGR